MYKSTGGHQNASRGKEFDVDGYQFASEIYYPGYVGVARRTTTNRTGDMVLAVVSSL